VRFQGRQSVRVANEIRGARREAPPGFLDIADVVIDQRPVECLLWVMDGAAGLRGERPQDLQHRTSRHRIFEGSRAGGGRGAATHR
jgi:hypothetical protein